MKCKWKYDKPWDDNYEGFYDTSCGNTFVPIEGTPNENKMKYCPYCGKEIEQIEED